MPRKLRQALTHDWDSSTVLMKNGVLDPRMISEWSIKQEGFDELAEQTALVTSSPLENMRIMRLSLQEFETTRGRAVTELSAVNSLIARLEGEISSQALSTQRTLRTRQSAEEKGDDEEVQAKVLELSEKRAERDKLNTSLATSTLHHAKLQEQLMKSAENIGKVVSASYQGDPLINEEYAKHVNALVSANSNLAKTIIAALKKADNEKLKNLGNSLEAKLGEANPFATALESLLSVNSVLHLLDACANSQGNLEQYTDFEQKQKLYDNLMHLGAGNTGPFLLDKHLNDFSDGLASLTMVGETPDPVATVDMLRLSLQHCKQGDAKFLARELHSRILSAEGAAEKADLTKAISFLAQKSRVRQDLKQHDSRKARNETKQKSGGGGKDNKGKRDNAKKDSASNEDLAMVASSPGKGGTGKGKGGKTGKAQAGKGRKSGKGGGKGYAKGGKGGKGAGSGKGKGKGSYQPPVTCWTCRQPGHVSRDCPSWNEWSDSSYYGGGSSASWDTWSESEWSQPASASEWSQPARTPASSTQPSSNAATTMTAADLEPMFRRIEQRFEALDQRFDALRDPSIEEVEGFEP